MTPRCSAPRMIALAALCAAIAVIASLVVRATIPTIAELQKAAQVALLRRNYTEAEALALRVIRRTPQAATSLLIAGEAAVGMGRFENALRYFEQVPNDGGRDAVSALCMAGDVLRRDLARASDAENLYRRAWKHDPRDLTANTRLAELLAVQTRTSEAIPFILELIRQGRFTTDHAILLGTQGGALNDPETVRKFHAAAASDPVIWLGMAYHAEAASRRDEAQHWLQRAILANPLFVEAQARLGQSLVESASPEEFLAWQAKLPPEADEHPGVWLSRAVWAQQHEQPRVAVRCYWEALRRDPNHRRANYQLAQVLLGLGEPSRAEPFLERAGRLQDLRDAVNRLVLAEFTGDEPLRKVVRLMESLGRLWEASAWSHIALRLNGRIAWARETLDRLRPLLEQNPPQTLDSANPALQTDLSDFPLPAGNSPPPGTATETGTEAVGTGEIHFVNDAPTAGLDFTYFHSPGPAAAGSRMFEFAGGGVAVLDYDGDSWPDLWFTQGCEWPVRPQQTDYLDRLYRNVQGRAFEDVTLSAGLAENRFSHGVTVGDVNSDGFPDLYVANIWANRLFRNNGDGTFHDITDETATAGNRWTTSCLMADLNGDAWPDVYAVNYLEADDVFERICHHRDGRPRQCFPFTFPGSQDQLYVNLGDGGFTEQTETAGIVVPEGKGLGIVAADFDGSGRLSLFIANDVAPNFLFLNNTPERGAEPRFVERGMASGVAVDAEGRSQGCMGVAAGDADNDGRLDLYITNFRDESNTLYVQSLPNLFLDATMQAGLREPSLPMLGFGTQFLDADLDGLADLVVANGHVDDLRAYGISWQMRPQFYHNLGRGRFAELPADSLGAWFEDEYLGRGLARLDWNRDGREDFAVSHLLTPAALLTNQTSGAGNFLALQLRGVRSDRDAIGTTVTLRTAGQTWVRQLTAGDGYQASNQRQIIFGLGQHDQIDSLTVRWPSGTQQSLSRIPLNAELLLIEGRSEPFLLPRRE